VALVGDYDAVWFMDLWERSSAGIAISVLPDFSSEDSEENVESPYCVRRYYVVDQHLEGPAGLAAARKKLADRGQRLILGFVPNHVAPDRL
jgi:glycosidase